MKNNRIRMTSCAGIVISIALTCGMSSCFNDVITLDLESIDTHIIIEGMITSMPGPYTIRLSEPVAYHEDAEFQPLTGADVNISDDHGLMDSLLEVEPGIYQTQTLNGHPGRTYTLDVNVEGETYTASSTMPQPVSFDSVRIRVEENCRMIYTYVTDPPDVETFGRLRIIHQNRVLEDLFYHDQFTDGESQVYRCGTCFPIGDVVFIQLFTLDRAAYEYFITIQQVTDDYEDGDFGDFDPEMPGFVPLTLSNARTNLSQGALGYFSAAALKTYTIPIL